MPLNSANLSSARLTNANLSSARLTNADLSGASLNRANLISAYLIRANLSGADLEEVNLSDADLSGAKLNGASFRCYEDTVENQLILPQCPNLKDVRWNDKTDWQGIQGWEKVQDIPPELKEQLEQLKLKNAK